MNEIDVNKLWKNFVDTFTNHYLDFDGRVARAPFWYYVLVVFVLGIGVSIIAAITTHLLSTLFSLAVFLPNLGMTVRRLHDTGKPGILVLLLAVPAVLLILLGLVAVLGGVFGFLAFLLFLSPIISLASLAAMIFLIYLCAQPGNSGPNAYGPEPVTTL